MLLYQHQLEHYSNIDQLTGIYNRGKIENLLKQEFERSKRDFSTFCMAIIDINKFKEINDTYGHNVGDKVLSQFAKITNSRIRKTDFFGRWGGDEFLLIRPNTSLDGIEKLISDIKSSVYSNLDTIKEGVTFSHGISIYKQDDTHYEQLVKRADVELYKVKKSLV
jgi:diguanylate cyclase (GGDEF)-like protein